MFSWLNQRLKDNRAKRQQRKLYKNDLEVADKYITRRSEKKAFEADMGIKTKMPKKRTVIPKSIEISGITLIKYTSYESDINSANEAAEDLKELGYKTKIMTYYRGSDPIYVLYRYKRGMQDAGKTPAKVKTAAKPKAAVKTKTKTKPKVKKQNAGSWYFC
jgi:hypothetical protein